MAAEQALQEATGIRPTDPKPYLRLAQLYLDWARWEDGLAAVAEAERLGAEAAETARLRAALYAELKDWREVVAHGEAVLTLYPEDTATRQRVALAYVALGRVGEARAEYGRLLEDDPTNSLARTRLAALLTLRDPNLALDHARMADGGLAADLQRILEMPVENRDYLLAQVGEVCLAYGESALAAAVLQRVIAHLPTYAEAHALLGRALIQMGQVEEGQEHLERAVDLAPNSVLARSLLGLQLLEAGDFSAARPHLEAAYDLDPQNPIFSVYLARVYAGLGQYDVAEIWIDEAARQAPEDRRIWEEVARFYLERSPGDEVRGVGAAQRVVELAPESGEAYDLLGWVYFFSGRYSEAEGYLRRALELNPTYAPAHYHLGQLYAYLGREEEARASLTRALNLNRDPALRVEIEEALSHLSD